MLTNATDRLAPYLAVQSAYLRAALRRLALETGGTCPVVVVAGDGAPRVRGDGFYHTTPSGRTRVAHPNAYGWRTVYHPSTRRVEVGEAWLRAALYAGRVAT